MVDESRRQEAGFGAGDWGGPYLAAAFLCEKVLIEQDGVQSAIRIVDRFFQNVTSIGGQVPATMPPLAVSLQMLLIRRLDDYTRPPRAGLTRAEMHGVLLN